MYLQPQIFNSEEGIVAGFSTRTGGVSEAPYTTLNLGLSTNDDKEAVLENRRRLFEAVGFSINDLAITGQVHGTELIDVDKPGLFVGYDAIVTKTPGIMLCLSAADCASVLISDAKNGVIGACHAGWRGTVGQIVTKTIDAMLERGASISPLRAYISPCISAENFEVGVEVAERFDPEFVRTIPGKTKPHVDLKQAIKTQLLDHGVSEAAIETSQHCTFADRKRFFSHRAEKGKTGRHMGFIGMKK